MSCGHMTWDRTGIDRSARCSRSIFVHRDLVEDQLQFTPQVCPAHVSLLRQLQDQAGEGVGQGVIVALVKLFHELVDPVEDRALLLRQ